MGLWQRGYGSGWKPAGVTPLSSSSPVLRHHRTHLLPGAGGGSTGLLIPGLGEGPVPGVL